MPAKYTKWTNIWKNLTPLDSSQLEVFLEFFSFLNSNLNFKFGSVWNRPVSKLVRTGWTGYRGFETGSKKNPDCSTAYRLWDAAGTGKAEKLECRMLQKHEKRGFQATSMTDCGLVLFAAYGAHHTTRQWYCSNDKTSSSGDGTSWWWLLLSIRSKL